MIIALEEAKYKLENFRKDVAELGSALRIDDLRNKAAELDKITSDPEFWNNQENSGKVLKEVKRIKEKITKYQHKQKKKPNKIKYHTK